jgi:pimeloyl-ACP methyl ester carboxylesterase
VKSFLLVHGAFRGGWAWDGVAPALRAAGHQVYAPSLYGCGERFTESLRGSVVGLADWSGEIVTALRELPAPVRVVGHSQGGVVALAAAATAPELVDRLVLLDSPVPAPGQCAADVVPADVTAGYGPPPTADTWVDAVPLAVDDDLALTPELVAWANAQLTPSPAGPAYDPAPSGGERVPRTVVLCTRTPPYVPCTDTRAEMDAASRPYHLLDAGHDAPLTHPQAVADLLLALA